MAKYTGTVQPPVIVIPGITTSRLRNEYDLPPTSVWSIWDKKLERVKLHPDDQRYDLREPARITPDHLFKVVYKEMIEELRFNLSTKADRPVPVYPFAYDWRQPLKTIEGELASFIDEVIERTKLMRHYAKDKYGGERAPVVNLVGHSMGGLIVVGYLQAFGANKVGKVATLATPFQGSYEAVIKVATGTANFGTSPPSSREREVARVTPALYHLLPSFPDALTVPPGLSSDLFDPSVWQLSVTASIEEYIRLHGLEPSKRKKQAPLLFNAMLNAAKAHRGRTDRLKLADIGLEPCDWLCVVGVDAETRVRLAIDVDAKGRPRFNFQSSDRMNAWTKPGDDAHYTGDGTVPFLGAVPKFLDRENLVCVCPEDFSYWELYDKVLLRVGGFHSIFPNMNMLHRLIVRHFTGRADPHGNTWGRPAPGVSDEMWDPPIAGLQRK